MKTKDLDLYKQLHLNDKHYGSTPFHHAPKIIDFIVDQKPKSILDFGCGKGSLKTFISNKFPEILFDNYDPAISEYSSINKSSYDMVISVDVMEHLYEDEISGIFQEMINLNPSSMYHVICHRLAHAILPDKTNAHKTVQPPSWWLDKFRSFPFIFNYNVSFESDSLEAGYFNFIKK